MRGATSVAANLLAWTVRGGSVAVSPFARLWRLACLRAVSTGSIPVTTQFDGPVYTAGRVRLSLGEHCRLGRGVFFETADVGSIRLGEHVRLNAACVIVSHRQVDIGDHSLFGEYVTIRDANHGTGSEALTRMQPHDAKLIRIGRDVWIGRGSVILPGVTIGDGAIVGANSVVTRDVSPMAIAAGAPARVLRARSPSGVERAPEPAGSPL